VERAQNVAFNENLRRLERIIDMRLGSGVDDDVDFPELGKQVGAKGCSEIVKEELDLVICSPARQPVK